MGAGSSTPGAYSGERTASDLLTINFDALNPFDPSIAPSVNHTHMYFNAVDLVPDFSFAGAFASNKPLPDPFSDPHILLTPTNSSHDRTKDIQSAINKLGDRGGGVVELAAGVYLINSESIKFPQRNVTLRGELPSEADERPPTTLQVSGNPREVFTFSSEDAGEPEYSTKAISNIREDYVPTGRTYVAVEDASVFSVGQMVEIQRVISSAWIKELKMNLLYRDGETQTWIPAGETYRQVRQVTAIDLEDHLVSFNFGLTDSLNATLGAQGKVVAFTPPEGVATGNGVENLSVFLDQDQSGMAINDPDKFPSVAGFNAFTQDNWMRQVFMEGFNSFINVKKRANRITLQDLIMSRPSVTNASAGFPADLPASAFQARKFWSTVAVRAAEGFLFVLMARPATIGVVNSTSFTVVTQSLTAGPNAIVEHRTQREDHGIQPHARWATGVLVDNSFVGNLVYRNRGTAGSGQGWSAAYSIAYNTSETDSKLLQQPIDILTGTTGSTCIQSPPMAFNLGVGNIGDIGDDADLSSLVSLQTHVSPRSMFAQQLGDRLGDRSADILAAPAKRPSKKSPSTASNSRGPSRITIRG